MMASTIAAFMWVVTANAQLPPHLLPEKGFSGEKQTVVTYTTVYKNGVPVNVYQTGVRLGGQTPQLKP